MATVLVGVEREPTQLATLCRGPPPFPLSGSHLHRVTLAQTFRPLMKFFLFGSKTTKFWIVDGMSNRL